MHFYIVSQSVSSVAQSCLTLCDPMDCSTPGLPVHHQLPEFTKFMSIESVMHPTILSVVPFSSCLQSSLASGSFQMSQLFTSGGQSIGVSASTSVLYSSKKQLTLYINLSLSCHTHFKSSSRICFCGFLWIVSRDNQVVCQTESCFQFCLLRKLNNN